MQSADIPSWSTGRLWSLYWAPLTSSAQSPSAHSSWNFIFHDWCGWIYSFSAFSFSNYSMLTLLHGFVLKDFEVSCGECVWKMKRFWNLQIKSVFWWLGWRLKCLNCASERSGVVQTLWTQHVCLIAGSKTKHVAPIMSWNWSTSPYVPHLFQRSLLFSFLAHYIGAYMSEMVHLD